MSKQTLDLRGRRARAERRRAEKALKRRLESEIAIMDDAPDGLSVDDAPTDLSGVDVPNGLSMHNAANGASLNGAPGGAPGYDTSGGPDAPPPSTEAAWTGLVAGVQRGGFLTVLAEGRTYGASVARDLVRQGYALTVGDRVRAVPDTPGRVTIVDVEPRRTKLARVREDRSRRSAFSREEAVLAANVDVAVIVAAVADPPFHPKLVDRFLVICLPVRRHPPDPLPEQVRPHGLAAGPGDLRVAWPADRLCVGRDG